MCFETLTLPLFFTCEPNNSTFPTDPTLARPTGQAPGKDSEVYLVPVAFYPDPFRPVKGNYLVLCECTMPDGKTPIPSNTRRQCAARMAKAADAAPWFGIEQEFTLFDKVHRLR